MAKGQKKTDVIMRTEKWELRVSPEQENLLIDIGKGLREIYHWGLKQWMEAYEQYREEKKAGVKKPNIKLPTFFDQVNQLTALGKADESAGLFRAKILRNWKEETLDSLHGALKSYFKLREKGDQDARKPKPRLENRFCAIPGRSGFSIRGNKIVLGPNVFGKETLSFPIPTKYQTLMLARASKMLKFVVSRDEANLAKPGRYWISVSYEFPKPEMRPFVPERAAYIALGASSVGIISPKGEKVIELWRSDKHWKPKTDAIESSLKRKAMGTNLRPIQKGSKKWRKLMGKRAKMFRIMGAQQTQDRREVVSDLLGANDAKRDQERKETRQSQEGLLRFLHCEASAELADKIFGHGVHFVVTEYIVRSKEGKLADSSKLQRSGPLGLNWSAQNTGSIAYFVQWLKEKAQEYGGSVQTHKLPYEALPKDLPQGHENKILMARALRDDFLKSFNEAA